MSNVEIVYILGSTRSGTSALRNALAQTRYKGYGEGHLVPLLSYLEQEVRAQKETGVGAKVPGNGLYELAPNMLVRHFFSGYERYLSKQLNSAWILDKTPTIAPIDAAPMLNTFHHSAKFIHCSRRHLDNIQSKQKKFARVPFERHCQEWKDCNRRWLEVREELAGNYIEFDFYDLATRPDDICERIAAYLGLDDNDQTAMVAYLESQRPQSTPDRDLTQFLKWSEIDWDSTQRASFEQICTDIGTRLGYGLDDYYL